MKVEPLRSVSMLESDSDRALAERADAECSIHLRISPLKDRLW